ncbi:MAG: phosphoglycerate kinase [Candidatus Rokubacteria bacterium]|nr:phosphoglycerate kinase [Candidatus Rokubacteria bacterium]
MSKLSVEQLDLQAKRVFLRADLNVPLAGGDIADDSRLRAVLPTAEYCLKGGAGVVLASHLGRPRGKPDPSYSLAPVARRLEELLGRPVPLAPDCAGETCEKLAQALRPGECLLLENLRFDPGEEANDPAFAQALARLADCYVNDAFAASHRAHASIVAITRYLKPAAAGLLMQRELAALERVLDRPAHPLVAILGGAKVSDKLGLIRHLLARADSVLIGGAMAFTFLRALGHEVGRSLVEIELVKTALEVLAEARARGIRVGLPVDVVVAADPESADGVRTVGIREVPRALMALDIGPTTLARFKETLERAKTVVWNGPMGVFEKPAFAAGTLGLARAVADSSAFSVVGGGETAAAVRQAGVGDKIGFLSTAGGAFLEFLEGRELPGVAVLTEA